MNIAIVILAAGKGKRMGLVDKPKVMAEISQKPLIGFVMEAVLPLNPDFIIPVIGVHKEIVEEYLQKSFPGKAQCVVQSEQLGTGHAVQQSQSVLNNFKGKVLILTGDTPLIKTDTLNKFILASEEFTPKPQAVTLSAFTDSPFGYGRIVRNASGDFTGIVEEKDANDQHKNIQEINTGIFLVDAQELFSALSKISNTNAQGEFYLTDIIAVLQHEGKHVAAIPSMNFDEFRGINTIEELEKARQFYQSQQS